MTLGNDKIGIPNPIANCNACDFEVAIGGMGLCSGLPMLQHELAKSFVNCWKSPSSSETGQ